MAGNNMHSDIDWDAIRAEIQDMEDDEEEDLSYMDYDVYNHHIQQKQEPVTRIPIIMEKKAEPIDEEAAAINKVYGEITDKEIKDASVSIYPEKKIYRSRLLDIFKPEQVIEIEKLSRTFSISNNRKIDLMKEKMTEWGINYTPLGSGTNRFGLKTDLYVIKIACDKDGKIDNKREFIYSRQLQPYVIKAYETYSDGIIAVFEYVNSFTIDDYWVNQDKMRKILSDVCSNFLVGDVGISTKNYGNWGYREDGSLVILDFAYIYDVKFKTFNCECGNMLAYDKDYVNLICSRCGKKYDFQAIRKRITREDQDAEIGDITTKGYILRSPEEVKDFNPKFVLDAMDKVIKKVRKTRKANYEKYLQESSKKSRRYIIDPTETIEDIVSDLFKGGKHNG